MKKLFVGLLALLFVMTVAPTKVSATITGGSLKVKILGDILVKKADETNDKYNTTSQDIYEVKRGDILDFTSTLYTGAIKEQLKNFSIDIPFLGKRTIEDNTLITSPASSFVTTIVFPDNLDISGVNVEEIKKQYNKDESRVLRYDPESGTYDQSYTAPIDERKKIIDTNYHNDDVKAFYISDVKIEGQKIVVTMTLNTETYYTAPNNTLGKDTTYAGYLKAAVFATPDYLALSIKGVKVKDSTNYGEKLKVSAKVEGKFSVFKEYFGSKFPLNLTWGSKQDIDVKNVIKGNYSGKDSCAENDEDIICTLGVEFPDKFIVTYDVNGGKTPIAPVEVDPGEKAPTKETERDGYEFVHWAVGKEDGPKYDFEQPVVDDLLLVAKWAKKVAPNPKPTPVHTPTKPVQKKVINTATK